MYLPSSPGTVIPLSMIAMLTPLDTFQFTLDISGVLGIFGGDEAISAMATVHIYKGRRWLGWYNSPGSYQIAKRYGLVATSRLFKGLFPGVRTDPAKLFEFNGWQGPRFQAVHSGTFMDSTGHLASVLMKQCASQEINEEYARRDGPGVKVSVVELGSVPPKEIDLPRFSTYSPFFAIIPIATSFAACVASAFRKDWISAFLILWGILSNGISCLVIGAGTLRFTHHIPSAGSPAGDGVLGSDREFVLLRGDEGAVNSITQGKLSLEFPGKFGDEYIGYCSLLLTIQFIFQLLLIPQGSPFGQVMFISSLAVSWVYNSWLSSFDRDEIQQRILWEEVLQTPSSIKCNWSTRTSAVVFALCVLSPEEPRKILETLLPNDTKVWREWKETILTRLRNGKPLHFEEADWNLEGYSDSERKLLETLYRDAQGAYDAPRDFLNG